MFLAEEVNARETHGGTNRVRAAHFPQVKTLDDFDFSFQRSVKQDQIRHLHQLDFLREKSNVIFLGPPGTGKTHLSIALGVQAARRGYRVLFGAQNGRSIVHVNRDWRRNRYISTGWAQLLDEPDYRGLLPNDWLGTMERRPQAQARFSAVTLAANLSICHA